MPVQYDIRRPVPQQVRTTTTTTSAPRQGYIVPKSAPVETPPAQEVAPTYKKYLPYLAGAYVLFLLLGRRK